MNCPHCQSAATTAPPNRTELGYRRFRVMRARVGLMNGQAPHSIACSIPPTWFAW
jgi:hypothetical protein